MQQTRQEKFEAEAAKLVQTGGLFAEMKAKCTFSTLSAICAFRGLKIAKKFTDPLNQEHVEQYKSKVTLGDLAKVATYINSVQIMRKTNPFDSSTLLTNTMKAVTVGENEIIFHSSKDNKRDCENGIIGGVDASRSAATIMSASVKLAMDKKSKKKENKVMTYHAENRYAPQEVLTTALRQVSVMVDASPDEINAQMEILEASKPEFKKAITDVIGLAAPQIQTKEDGQIVNKPLVVYGDDGKFSYRRSAVAKQAIQGEFNEVASSYSIYKMGSKYPPIKRIGRNMWTGAPIDTMNVDHVIALHDAGIPVDSKILVISSDTNIISSIRSNFGAGCYGVGRGPGLVLESKTDQYDWDFIYYPKAIVMNATGNFDINCTNILDSMTKMMKTHGSGKLICHVSPLMFYCQQFCDVFGIKYVKSETLGEMKTINVKEEPVKPTLYLPTECTHYPPGAPALREGDMPETHYKRLTSIGTVFTQLPWGSLDKTTVPMALTQLSYQGSMVFGGNIKEIPFARSLGMIVGHLRETFKALWGLSHRSPHRYKIRRMLKGAIVESLVWDDEWSALYGKDVQQMFEAEADVAMKQLEVQIEQQGEAHIPAQDQNVVVPKPVDKNIDIEESDDD